MIFHRVRASSLSVAVMLGLGAGALSLITAGLRTLLTVMTVVAVMAVAVRYRKLVAGLTLAVLPFLGLIRRLLIPVSGWPPYDPLLLIAPVVVLTLVFLSWWGRTLSWNATPLSRSLTFFVAWMAVEMVNPVGGVLGNIAGGIYIVVPLLWFYVGRVYADRVWLRETLVYVLVSCVLIGSYGLYQTFVGFPPWDAAWLQLGGYTALHVGGVIRAFGTLPSSAEYGSCMAIGMVVSFALLVRGGPSVRHWRPLLVSAFAITGLALILESQRGALVDALIACIVLWSATGTTSRAVRSRWLGAIATAGAVYLLFAPSLQHLSVGGRFSGLVTHETSFFADPLGRNSTLPGHLRLVLEGITNGVRWPLGYGPGAVSIGGKLGVGTAAGGTEFDLSNAFTAGGVIGGLLFLPLWVRAWFQLSASVGGRDWAMAAVLGIAVAAFGNWLNGGQYFVSALVWLLLGIHDGILANTTKGVGAS
jgi:hypothetical protein